MPSTDPPVYTRSISPIADHLHPTPAPVPLPTTPYLIGAKPVSLLVRLNREAVVQQEPVVALLAIAVVHLGPSFDSVQRRDCERPALVVVRPFRLPRPARKNIRTQQTRARRTKVRSTQKKTRPRKNTPLCLVDENPDVVRPGIAGHCPRGYCHTTQTTHNMSTPPAYRLLPPRRNTLNTCKTTVRKKRKHLKHGVKIVCVVVERNHAKASKITRKHAKSKTSP